MFLHFVFSPYHRMFGSMKTIRIALILVCALAHTTLLAQTNSLYRFLRNDASARSAALGGAFVAMPEDPAGLFYNPASVATLAENRIAATYLKHALDINSGFLSYNSTLEGLGDNGSFAVGINYINYGSFDRADRNGNILGTFGGYDLAAVAAYSNMLDSNLYYGVALNFITNSLESSSSSAVALDAGLLYRMPEARTNIGLSILHAGSQLSTIGGVSEQLPLDIRVGLNHRLRGLPLLLNVSLHHLADETDAFWEKFENFSLGGELYISSALRIRLGYDNQRRAGLAPESQKKLAGLSAGLGIIIKDINIDYAMSSFGTVGTLHRFSVAASL